MNELEQVKLPPFSVTRWYWCRSENGCTGHAKVDRFEELRDAASFRRTVEATPDSWVPRGCLWEVSPVEGEGQGIAKEFMTPEAWQKGMREVREALAKAKGPLFSGTKKPTGTPSAHRDAVDASEYDDPGRAS